MPAVNPVNVVSPAQRRQRWGFPAAVTLPWRPIGLEDRLRCCGALPYYGMKMEFWPELAAESRSTGELAGSAYGRLPYTWAASNAPADAVWYGVGAGGVSIRRSPVASSCSGEGPEGMWVWLNGRVFVTRTHSDGTKLT